MFRQRVGGDQVLAEQLGVGVETGKPNAFGLRFGGGDPGDRLELDGIPVAVGAGDGEGGRGVGGLGVGVFLDRVGVVGADGLAG